VWRWALLKYVPVGWDWSAWCVFVMRGMGGTATRRCPGGCQTMRDLEGQCGGGEEYHDREWLTPFVTPCETGGGGLQGRLELRCRKQKQISRSSRISDCARL
jgi:hypothetical protein